MDSTPDKPSVLRKAEHRLRKKNENCAKAQRKKLIFAGDFHELSPLSQGFRLVNPCLGIKCRPCRIETRRIQKF